MRNDVFRHIYIDRLTEIGGRLYDAHDAACNGYDFRFARAALAEMEAEIENARQVLDVWEEMKGERRNVHEKSV